MRGVRSASQAQVVVALAIWMLVCGRLLAATPPKYYFVALDEMGQEIGEQYLFDAKSKEWRIIKKNPRWGIFEPGVLKEAYSTVPFKITRFCGIPLAETESTSKWITGHLALNHTIELHKLIDGATQRACIISESIAKTAKGYGSILCKGNLAEAQIFFQASGNSIEVCHEYKGGASFLIKQPESIYAEIACNEESRVACRVGLQLDGLIFVEGTGKEQEFEVRPKERRIVKLRQELSQEVWSSSPLEQARTPTPIPQPGPAEKVSTDDLDTFPMRLSQIENSAKELRSLNSWLRSERLTVNVEGGKCVAADLKNLRRIVEQLKSISVSPLAELNRLMDAAQKTKDKLVTAASGTKDKAAKDIIDIRLQGHNDLLERGTALKVSLEIAVKARKEYLADLEERIGACVVQ